MVTAVARVSCLLPAVRRFVVRAVTAFGRQADAMFAVPAGTSALAAEDLALAEPAEAEAELVHRLLHCALPAAQYRQAMAELAAADTDRGMVIALPDPPAR
jgi:hypothetical protein